MLIRNQKIENGSIFFIYLFVLSNLFITIQYTTAQPQPDYVYHVCSGDNYTTNSTFKTNLNLLFSSIIIRDRYYNDTVGQSPDTVYGSLQCRGDMTLDECQSCIGFATQDFNKTERCPNSKQAIIWYEKCMLRYSNQNYFTIMLENPTVYLSNVNNVSDPDQFNRILGELMNELAQQAESSSSNNFAAGNKNITSFTKVYGLVQCTDDITLGSCNRCLLGAISQLPNCCDGKRGGRVIRPSCNIRYELNDPFFESSTLSPSPPPPLSSPTPPSSTNATVPNANSNNSARLTIRIVVPLVIAVFFAIAFVFFCFRKKKTHRKKYD
ncbi:hypothetical protein MKX01_031118, partial [Papaver californicum]